MQLSWYERRKNVVQSFPSLPGLYFVNEDHIRCMHRWHHVNAVIPMSLWSPYCVLIRSGPRYVFFFFFLFFFNIFKTHLRQPRPFLRTKFVTKKEMNKCMAEIYDPGGIRTRAARLIIQYHNH